MKIHGVVYLGFGHFFCMQMTPFYKSNSCLLWGKNMELPAQTLKLDSLSSNPRFTTYKLHDPG